MNELIDIENALLGSFILTPQSFEELYPIIKGITLNEKNGLVLSAIDSLASESAPIDLLTVVNKLRDQGNLEKVGGAYYVSQLTIGLNKSVSEYHAFMLKERDIKHKVYAIGSRIISGFEQNKDVFDLLADLEKDLSDARAGLARVKVSDAYTAVAEYQQERNEVIQSHAGLIGMTTGIECLDHRLKGWRKKLYIVAARPGMGKSALMTYSALMGAKSGEPIAIFSFEMGRAEIVGRMISAITGLDSEKIANHEYVGTPYQDQIEDAENIISSLPIFIEECAGMSALDIKAISQRLDIETQRRYNKPLKAVFIDYLQLMSSADKKAGNREQEVSSNSRELKLLSKRYAVIALSQLGRAVESTADKRPDLHHLRDSGAIEQDADSVMFLFRPEYYNITEDENGNSLSGLCELIVRKLRGGKIGTELTRISLQTMSFSKFEIDW